MAEAGDYVIPIAEGLYEAGHLVAEIGELVAGDVPDRNWAGRLTTFKSTGAGVQDLIIARHVYQVPSRMARGLWPTSRACRPIGVFLGSPRSSAP